MKNRANSSDVATYMTEYCEPHLDRINDLLLILRGDKTSSGIDSVSWQKENKRSFEKPSGKILDFQKYKEQINATIEDTDKDGITAITEANELRADDLTVSLTPDKLDLLVETLTYFVLN